MAEKRNPGALAGATGAGCLRAAAFSPQHIARPEGRRHHAGHRAYHITPDDGGPTFTLYLRGRGVPIVTQRERHGGAFPGVHGRYRLAARVRRAAP